MRIKAALLACACTWALTTAAYAETAKTDAGIRVQTANGVLTVEPFSDRVIHVRFGADGFAGNYNPAVIAKPARSISRSPRPLTAWC